MKSEERHRLQESELEKLGRHARDFWNSFAKDYAKPVLIGLGVTCLIAVVVVAWMMSSAAAKAEQWKDVIVASFETNTSQSLDAMELAADKHADSLAGQWAALMQAEQVLRNGIIQTRIDHDAAVDDLTRARDYFTRLENSDSQLIQERRAFGMARCLEALAGVDVTKDSKGKTIDTYGENVSVKDAIAAYKKFVETYASDNGETASGGQSIFVPFAKERIEALSTKSAQDFYAMYRKEFPSPEDRATPADGPGASKAIDSGHPIIGGSKESESKEPEKDAASDESAIKELEAIVNEAKEKANAEKPDGPALKSPGPSPFEVPKDGEKKPAEPDETKPDAKPDETRPDAAPDAKPDEKPDAKADAEPPAKTEE